jgi:S-layer protein (TIGR01567 family)
LDFDIIRPEGEDSVHLLSFQNISVKSGTKITGNLDTGGKIQAIQSGSRTIQPTLNGTVDLTGFALVSPQATEGERESISRDDHPSNVIYDSWNKDTVDNGHTCSPFFTIDEPMTITYIDTYHWNYGEGAPGGTISLRDGEGTLYGPWEAETSQDGGAVPKGYWIVHPKEAIPAGSYTIEDSEPDTWSKNSESPCGMAKVEGYAVESSASPERGAPAAGTKDTGSSAAPPKKGASYTDSGMAEPAIQSSQERGSVAQEEIADAGTNSYATDKATSSPAKEDFAAGGPEPFFIGESAYAAASAPSIEIRGQVAAGNFEWTAQNFAGFYYDPESEMGTEVLTATLTDGKLSGSQPFGLYYQTTAQRQDFAFRDWGSYQVMGFLGEKCFAGYIDGSDSGKGYLFEKSSNKSALAKGQLCKVLVDDDSEKTITSKTPLMLEEGYRLELKHVNPDDGQAYANLLKGDKLVKDFMFQPSKDEAKLSDKTCFFRDPSLGLVTIAVHFKNAFAGADQNLATIDGIWQVSESPISVAKGISFDKLTVSEVTDRSIVMNNVDQTIILNRDKNIALAGDMRIRTADTDFLRYYLVKEESPSDLSRVEGYADASEDVSPATGLNRMASEVEPDLKEAVSTPHITSASNSLDELSYSDDFSDTNSGWSRASNSPDLDAMGYDDGRYHIIRKKPGQSWSYPPDSPIFRDFVVEVEANQEEGPDNNQYGLVLRRDASGNYYCFQISGAGNYRFDVNLNGNWREIVPDTWSSKINTGRDKNVLRVVCSGESFIFYANGAKIGEAQDSSITSGRVGLVAGSLDDQRLHISFDNLKVWAL